MAIQFLPMLTFTGDINYLLFDRRLEGELVTLELYGTLGTWNNPTYFIVKVSGVLWLIPMEEIRVEISEPQYTDNLSVSKDEPALNVFVSFYYHGKDEQFWEAVKAERIAESPYLQRLLAGKKE